MMFQKDRTWSSLHDLLRQQAAYRADKPQLLDCPPHSPLPGEDCTAQHPDPRPVFVNQVGTLFLLLMLLTCQRLQETM